MRDLRTRVIFNLNSCAFWAPKTIKQANLPFSVETLLKHIKVVCFTFLLHLQEISQFTVCTGGCRQTSGTETGVEWNSERRQCRLWMLKWVWEVWERLQAHTDHDRKVCKKRIKKVLKLEIRNCIFL